MNRIPAARQAASVPPTVVAPVRPRTAAAARSRGPALSAEASKRSSSAGVSPTTSSPSSTPDGRRDRAAVAHRLLGGEPDLEPRAGREAVRDERRLERDDGAPLGERVARPPR